MSYNFFKCDDAYVFFFNPFPNKPWFLRVCGICLLKTLWEKEKLLVTSNFSLSHCVFNPISRTLSHFYQIQNGRLQTLSVWKGLTFVVWERVKYIKHIFIMMDKYFKVSLWFFFVKSNFFFL